MLAAVVEAGVRAFGLEDSLAAPTAAIRALGREIASGSLAEPLATTVAGSLQGFAIAAAIGVPLGLALGRSGVLRDLTFVVVELLRPVPGVALIPVAILLFGLGVPMVRFVVAFAALWPILLHTMYGARAVDPMLHDVARTAGLGRVDRTVRVTFPAALPRIATGVRVAAAVALLVAVTAEFVSGTAGLGAYMQRQQLALRLPELSAAVLLVGLLGYAVNVALRSAERRVLFWAGEELAARR